MSVNELPQMLTYKLKLMTLSSDIEMHIRLIRTGSFHYICFEYPQPLFLKTGFSCWMCVFHCALQYLALAVISSLKYLQPLSIFTGPSAHFLAFLFRVRGL